MVEDLEGAFSNKLERLTATLGGEVEAVWQFSPNSTPPFDLPEKWGIPSYTPPD